MIIYCKLGNQTTRCRDIRQAEWIVSKSKLKGVILVKNETKTIWSK